MRFFMSGFLHELIVPIPLRNILKKFQKYFHFHGDIHEIKFPGTIPCDQRFPGIGTRIFFDLREQYPEIYLSPGICTRKFVWAFFSFGRFQGISTRIFF